MVAHIQNRSGPRLRAGHDLKIMSEINVTPFVDVMLVLLVVFMVTAPLLTVGVQIDLPKTKAGFVQGQDEPLAVSIDGRGRLFLQETEIPFENLVPRLIAISGNKPDIRIFVRGDKNIPYGRVMDVMGRISQAGFSRVALITATPDAAGARKR
jgi:biopolymer transport protein TolR